MVVHVQSLVRELRSHKLCHVGPHPPQKKSPKSELDKMYYEIETISLTLGLRVCCLFLCLGPELGPSRGTPGAPCMTLEPQYLAGSTWPASQPPTSRSAGLLPMWVIKLPCSIPSVGQAKQLQFYLKLYKMTWIFWFVFKENKDVTLI